MIRQNLYFLLVRAALCHLRCHNGQAVFVMHCSFLLFSLNFNWPEVPIHQKAEPACYLQPAMGAQSISTLFSECISEYQSVSLSADKIKSPLQAHLAI